VSLAKLLKAVQDDLPITMRHERWLIDNADPVYSEAAIQFSDDFLRGKVGGHRHRTPSFRASGMGSCKRKRVFARVGTAGISEQFDSKQANTFATGNFMHRKWQMSGITEGWLTRAEVPLHSPELDLGGTADGYIYDGSLFEFKTINSRGWRWVSSTRAPEDKHVLQVGAYKLLDPSLKAASIVYENKESGEWREFRVQFSDEILGRVSTELSELRDAVTTQTLPDVLDDCAAKKGTTYRQCPFREICLKTRTWPKGVAKFDLPTTETAA
jgi:uncharacterized protein YeaO (DUF488 family)